MPHRKIMIHDVDLMVLNIHQANLQLALMTKILSDLDVRMKEANETAKISSNQLKKLLSDK